MSLWIVDRTALMIFGAVVTFQRTPQLREREYPSEPRSYGTLQLVAVGDTVLTPIADDEAFWLGIDTPAPVCIRVRINADPPIDATNGRPWNDALEGAPRQNYIVSPPQRALNGVLRNDGACRCFARVSLNSDAYYACSSLTLFASRLHVPTHTSKPSLVLGSVLLPDPFGVAAWDTERVAKTNVRLLSPEEFRRDTGLLPKQFDEREGAGRWRL